MSRSEVAAGRNGAGRGSAARGYKWLDFQKENVAGMRSGFWATPTMREADRVEVEEIAAAVRDLCPLYVAAFELAVEQLACRLWRQRRAYADLSERGVVRDGLPAPVLAGLARLESQISKDLEGLGLTPRSAAALGVDVAVAQRTLSLVEYWRGRELEDDGDEDGEGEGGGAA